SPVAYGLSEPHEALLERCDEARRDGTETLLVGLETHVGVGRELARRFTALARGAYGVEQSMHLGQGFPGRALDERRAIAGVELCDVRSARTRRRRGEQIGVTLARAIGRGRVHVASRAGGEQ